MDNKQYREALKDSAHYRALVPEYHARMSQENAWPGNKYSGPWIRKHCGAPTDIATRLRNREYVEERHAQAFLLMLSDDNAHEQTARAREITRDFLHERGVLSLSPESLSAAVEHLLTPAVSQRPPTRTPAATDWLAGRWYQAATWLHGDFDVRCVRGCRREDIPRAVEWIFTRVAQCSPAAQHEHSRLPLVRQAEKTMHTKYEAYVAQAQTWVDANPWSVVWGWHRTQQHGVLITLPVTEHAYARILAGQMQAMECGAKDLCETSRYIIIEAAAERPTLLNLQLDKLTWPIFVAFAYQLSALTRCNRLSEPTTLHLASFAGTDLNRDRLVRSHFIPTGTKAPGSGVDVFKRDVRVGTFLSRFQDVAPLLWLGAFAPERPYLGDE